MVYLIFLHFSTSKTIPQIFFVEKLSKLCNNINVFAFDISTGYCIGPESMESLCNKIRVEAVLYTIIRGNSTRRHLFKTVRDSNSK